MKNQEFINWLRGFLDGVEELKPHHKQKIEEKLNEIDNSVKGDLKDYLTIGACNNECPGGGCHDYDYPWFSTAPPHCKKCGKQQDWSIPAITSTYTINQV